MKPSIKKAVSGKTMRVATTFTGAAALAGFYAPPAMAVAAHVVNQPVLKGVRQGARPAISTGNCNGRSHWLHLGYKGGDWCFGNSGIINDSILATSFCGGNNIGWIEGQYDSTQRKDYFTAFGPGTFYAHIPGTSEYKPLIVEYENISYWSGNDKCGLP